MKLAEKLEARKLRQEGYSLYKIASTLHVAKSSVSSWVRDIQLTTEQIQKLSEASQTTVAIEKRRNARLLNEKNKRDKVQTLARSQIKNVSYRELWLIGVMLYWAEGGKTQRTVRFSNGDPEMIKTMMRFFREVCKVPEGKFRGYIHIHPHLDHINAETYWSDISNIPLQQFFKTYRIQNRSSKNKKDSLPYGVMDIYVLDTELFLRIAGWAEGIFNTTNKNQ